MKLQTGDVILSVNDKLVTEMDQLSGIVHASDENIDSHVLHFKVVRDGKIVDLDMKTVQVDETDQIVIFAGCILQKPHHAVRQAMSDIPKGCIVHLEENLHQPFSMVYQPLISLLMLMKSQLLTLINF